MSESDRRLLGLILLSLIGIVVFIYLSNLLPMYNKYVRRIGNDRYVAEVTKTPGKTFVKNIMVDYGK